MKSKHVIEFIDLTGLDEEYIQMLKDNAMHGQRGTRNSTAHQALVKKIRLKERNMTSEDIIKHTKVAFPKVG